MGLASIVIYFYNIWDVVNAVGTILLVIAAIVAAVFAAKNLQAYRQQLSMYRKEIELNTFLALLKEISDEQARRERHMVLHYISPEYKVEDIKRLVQECHEEKSGKASDIGAAIELTIARLDRVGFFLIGNDNKLTTEQIPLWLWTIVSQIWERLGKWVEYRQTKKEDTDFWHEGYGLYFQRLAEEGRRQKDA